MKSCKKARRLVNELNLNDVRDRHRVKNADNNQQEGFLEGALTGNTTWRFFLWIDLSSETQKVLDKDFNLAYA